MLGSDSPIVSYKDMCEEHLHQCHEDDALHRVSYLAASCEREINKLNKKDYSCGKMIYGV